MVKNFYSDLAAAKTAEKTVLELFSSLAPQYTFRDVSDIREFFYKGDIEALNPSGKYIYIEVKQDGRIHETHNVLCEEEVLFFDTGFFPGNMKNAECDIYCVVSPHERCV